MQIITYTVKLSVNIYIGGICLGRVIPNKWKKHLVLVEFGLKNYEDLTNEIHRYDAFRINNLIEDIAYDLIKHPNSGMYIISFVPTNSCFKLPNFCISSIEDLNNFKLSLQKDFLDKFSEVWYCKKLFEIGQDNIVGRISFDNKVGLNSIKCSQCIEQVWNCSHREIEKFNSNSSSIYLRASREGWGRSYSIDDLKVPSSDFKDKVINGFRKTIYFIESGKEKIDIFNDYLNSIGIEELCLEYMLSSKGFSFIDWDTSNDKKVIDNVFPKQENYEFVR